MKKKLLIALLLLTGSFTYAQETVKRSNSLTPYIIENFSVLKADKTVRHGQYTAKTDKKIIAEGSYNEGTRVGAWNFYNLKGTLVQTYNYNEKKITFLDTTDVQGIKYYMENVKPGDAVTTPAKIGGFVYGLRPLIFRAELNRVIHFEHPNARGVTYKHTFVIDNEGKVLVHEAVATVDGTDKLYKLDDHRIDPELMRFTPATINKHTVPCKITVISTAAF